MIRYWHYTTGVRFVHIMAAGCIRRAHVGVKVTGSRPAVWFSTRDSWEPTATKGILHTGTGERRRATIAEMIAHDGALVRIEVPASVARHPWQTHRQRYELAPNADQLEADAREVGSDPADWRVSYHDVPLSAVLSVEAMTGDTWERVAEPNPGGTDGPGLLVAATFMEHLQNVLLREPQGGPR